MASPNFPETELLRAVGNQLDHSEMVQLADGRVVSVGQNIRDVSISLTNPARGDTTSIDDLRGDDLRGQEHSAATRTLHTLHNTKVAALPDGGFVVAAQLNQNIGGSFSAYEQIVYLQYYNADGSQRGETITGAVAQNMSTQPGTVALLEHPQGVVLVTRAGDMTARFFDDQGELQAEHRLHSDRAYLPQAVVVEGDELLMVWFERSEGSPLFPREFIPAALAH